MIKKEVSDKLNHQLRNTSWSMIRAANLEVFPRMVDALHHRLDDCNGCRELNGQCGLYVEDIMPVITGSNDERIAFERLVERTFQHLKLVHAAVPKGKLLSTYVLIGMLLGLGSGVGVSFILGENAVGAGSLGWMVGLLAGWMSGKYKEARLKKENRLF